MLEKILNELVEKAKQNPNKEQVKKLKGNLVIYMIWIEPYFTMTLARDNQPPSTQEIKTCIAYLPKQIEPPTLADVRTTTHKERPALAVDFPLASYVQQMFE